MAQATGERISAYDIKRGDKFTVGGEAFEAVADAHGEFNAYVRVWNPRRSTVSEIVLVHGTTVAVQGR